MRAVQRLRPASAPWCRGVPTRLWGRSLRPRSTRYETNGATHLALSSIRNFPSAGSSARVATPTSRWRRQTAYSKVGYNPLPRWEFPREIMTQTKPNTNLVVAVVICFAAVLLTTSALWIIDHFRQTRHLLLGYLFLTIFIAIFFGGILALVTAFACGLSAAYFLLPPQFSFYVDDPAQINELIFIILLAVLATAGVGLTHGRTEYSSWWPP